MCELKKTSFLTIIEREQGSRANEIQFEFVPSPELGTVIGILTSKDVPATPEWNSLKIKTNVLLELMKTRKLVVAGEPSEIRSMIMELMEIMDNIDPMERQSMKHDSDYFNKLLEFFGCGKEAEKVHLFVYNLFGVFSPFNLNHEFKSLCSDMMMIMVLQGNVDSPMMSALEKMLPGSREEFERMMR